MGSVAPKIISKSSYEYISFKELQDDFFLSSLMNIKISHSHHFIVFDFTISGEDPFLIKNGFVKSFTYTHKLFANKFYFAKSYNLNSPKVFDAMPFFLYNNKGPNILIENNTKSDTNIFAETDFIIADGIDKELILIPSPPVGNKYKSSLEIIVNQIMDTLGCLVFTRYSTTLYHIFPHFATQHHFSSYFALLSFIDIIPAEYIPH